MTANKTIIACIDDGGNRINAHRMAWLNICFATNLKLQLINVHVAPHILKWSKPFYILHQNDDNKLSDSFGNCTMHIAFNRKTPFLLDNQ